MPPPARPLQKKPTRTFRQVLHEVVVSLYHMHVPEWGAQRALPWKRMLCCDEMADQLEQVSTSRGERAPQVCWRRREAEGGRAPGCVR